MRLHKTPKHGVRRLSPVVRGAQLMDLAQLYEHHVMLVTAPAPAAAGALLHAATLIDSGEVRAKAEVETPDGSPVPGHLERLALHDGPHSQAWLSYVERITEVFAYLLGAESIGVRLVVSDAPHCPRFHVDQVTARAVLTVIGAGTQWLEDRYVDRSHLGHAGRLEGDAGSGLVRDWSGLQHAKPGELAVFKGESWPDVANRSIVHRSPPADGIRRVVLTLDWLD